MTEVDNHKLMFHPERVAEWKRKGDCYPIYVEIGPTNKCNHKCMFCALDWLEKEAIDINKDVMNNTLEEMTSLGVKSVMFAGEGEPLLHKDISSFVQTAKKSGLDVSITTNGVPFNQKKANEIVPYLSWIRFSVDAGTPDTYSQIHGTKKEDFSRVLNNIQYAVNIKKDSNLPITIGVQVLLTNKSLNEIYNLAQKVKEIGVDNIQIKPYSHHPASKNDLSFEFNEAEKVREKIELLSDDSFKILYRNQTIKRLNNDRDYNICHGLPFFSLIDSKGNVIPCNMFYNNPEFSYGDLNEHSFSEIWNWQKRKDILKKINQKGINDCRKGCRLDVINRYLERLKNPHPHDNFI